MRFSFLILAALTIVPALHREADAAPPKHARQQMITLGTTETFGTTRTLTAGRMVQAEPTASPSDPIPAWLDRETRPLLAVGTILEINWSSHTLQVGIDRGSSVLPNSLEVRARQAKAVENLMDREFPERRQYAITSRTLTMDARLSHIHPPTPASTGRINEDKQRAPRAAFKPGQRVSVLYRMVRRAGQIPFVMNLSLLDPTQKVRLDYNPTMRKVQFDPNLQTTGTQGRQHFPHAIQNGAVATPPPE